MCFLANPFSGWLCDKVGPGWVTILSIILALPWWGVEIIEGPVALFITAFALQSKLGRRFPVKYLISISDFFVSGVIAPLVTDLADVATGIPGIGCKYSPHFL